MISCRPPPAVRPDEPVCSRAPQPSNNQILADANRLQEEDNARRLRKAMSTEHGLDSIPCLTPNHFQFLKPIGEGSFSTVYIARDATGESPEAAPRYAVKVMTKDLIVRHEKVASICRERNVLEHLSFYHGGSPFVNDMFASFQDKDFVYFVMGAAERGELHDFLKCVGPFDKETTKFYAGEIICGLEFVHKCGIIHRDLKPENILLTLSGHLQLADFGCAAIKGMKMQEPAVVTVSPPKNDAGSADAHVDAGQNVEEDPPDLTAPGAAEAAGEPTEIPSDLIQVDPVDPASTDSDSTDLDSPSNEVRERRSTFVGTAQYVSPEMLRGDEVEEPCDMWAFGCILFQMMTGAPPFRAINDYHLMKKINQQEYAIPDGFPSDAEDLMNSLVTQYPEDRLSASEVKKHPFFAGIDFANLAKTEPPEVYKKCRVTEVDVTPSLYEHIGVGFSHEIAAQLLELNQRLTASSMSQQLKSHLDNFNFDNLMEYPEDLPCSDKMLALTRKANAQRFRKDKIEKQKENPYNLFCRGELIIKQALIDKKKGMFSRTRMFVLTEGPRLFYVRPENMELKGEVPFSPHIECEVKDFRNFLVHTPRRTYNLYDPTANALEWCKVIMETKLRYKDEIAETYERALAENKFPAIEQDKRELRRSEQERLKAEKKAAKKAAKDEEKARKNAKKEEKKSASS